MFKVNYGNTRRRRSGVFVNFEHISNIFLVFLLHTLNKSMLPGLLSGCKAILKYSKNYVMRITLGYLEKQNITLSFLNGNICLFYIYKNMYAYNYFTRK